MALIGIVAHPGTVEVDDVGPVVHQAANPAYIRAHLALFEALVAEAFRTA